MGLNDPKNNPTFMKPMKFLPETTQFPAEIQQIIIRPAFRLIGAAEAQRPEHCTGH